MHIRLVSFMFLMSLLTLVAVHASALLFSLYWIYPWFDNPMHVLGGMTVALGFFYFSFIRVYFSKYVQEGLFGAILFVLVIGVFWEIYEYTMGSRILRTVPFDAIDTITDLCMDVIGATLGYFVARAFTQLDT